MQVQSRQGCRKHQGDRSTRRTAEPGESETVREVTGLGLLGVGSWQCGGPRTGAGRERWLGRSSRARLGPGDSRQSPGAEALSTVRPGTEAQVAGGAGHHPASVSPGGKSRLLGGRNGSQEVAKER